MDKVIVFFSFFILFVGNSYAKTEYYLTLRNEKVNLRKGPSLDHPIKLIYKKKFLPVLVIDSSYNFRNKVSIYSLRKEPVAINNMGFKFN